MRYVFSISIVCFALISSLLAFSEEVTTDKKSLLIDKAITSFMQQHEVPGVAIAIVNGDSEKILTYGLADKKSNAKVTENTLFEIASITKVFTTTALALNVLQGNMGLNDPISKYIPGLDSHFSAINKVTLLELATHTSSLPRVGGSWREGGLQKIVSFLQHWQPNYPIGARYEYSNLAFGLLGYALEAVEKRPYEEIIAEDVLKPLGMNMTFTRVPESQLSQYAQGYDFKGKEAPRRIPGYLLGSGALRSTVKDMLKFLKANMGINTPEKLLKAMQLAQQPFYNVRKHFIMGLGWQRFDFEDTLIINKNGGLTGFASYIGWMPEKKIGIIILTNKGKARPTALGRYLLTALSKQN
jgi:beta-lactamase class C